MTKYLTGMIALNVFPGWDWHVECLEQVDFEETDNLHGVDFYETITCKGGKVLSNVWIANPYRAIADYARSSCSNGLPDAVVGISKSYDYNKEELANYLYGFNLKIDGVKEALFSLVGKQYYHKAEELNANVYGCDKTQRGDELLP